MNSKETKECTRCKIKKPHYDFCFRNKAKNIRHEQCKKCINNYASQYREKNRLSINKKQNKKSNSKTGKLKRKNYAKKNAHKRREYERKRYHTDSNYRLKKILRSRMAKVLKGEKKSKKTLGYTGITFIQLRQWFEFQFDEHMNWENQGSYWHIDHVIPCSSFDFTNELDIEKCFEWPNMRPLEGTENDIKSDKIIQSEIDAHENIWMDFYCNVLDKDNNY